jgi:hypothetical protein
MNNPVLMDSTMDEIMKKQVEIRNKEFLEYVIEESETIEYEDEWYIIDAIQRGMHQLRDNGFGNDVDIFVQDELEVDIYHGINVFQDATVPEETVVIVDSEAVGRSLPYDWRPWVVMNPSGVVTVVNE